MKNKTKKMSKNYMKTQNSILYSELAPMTRDETCSRLQRYGENVGDKKLSVEHTLFLVYPT